MVSSNFASLTGSFIGLLRFGLQGGVNAMEQIFECRIILFTSAPDVVPAESVNWRPALRKKLTQPRVFFAERGEDFNERGHN